MTAFVVWIRCLFCRHEWSAPVRGELKWQGKTVPYKIIDCRECKKCGWIWKQSIP